MAITPALSLLSQSMGGNGTDFLAVLTSASPIGMLAIFVIALSTGKLVLPRELDNRDKRIAQLEAELDQYKSLAFGALKIGEQVASVVERDRR